MKQLLILLILLFLTSCKSKPVTIVGTWHGNQKNVLTFKSDGTCIINKRNNEITGTYTYNEDTLTMLIKGKNDTFVVTELHAEYLYLKRENETTPYFFKKVTKGNKKQLKEKLEGEWIVLSTTPQKSTIITHYKVFKNGELTNYINGEQVWFTFPYSIVDSGIIHHGLKDIFLPAAVSNDSLFIKGDGIAVRAKKPIKKTATTKIYHESPTFITFHKAKSSDDLIKILDSISYSETTLKECYRVDSSNIRRSDGTYYLRRSIRVTGKSVSHFKELLTKQYLNNDKYELQFTTSSRNINDSIPMLIESTPSLDGSIFSAVTVAKLDSRHIYNSSNSDQASPLMILHFGKNGKRQLANFHNNNNHNDYAIFIHGELYQKLSYSEKEENLNVFPFHFVPGDRHWLEAWEELKKK